MPKTLTELTCGRPVIFHDGLCRDTSVVHATDDFVCFEVRRKTFVECSTPHCSQYGKCALLFSNTQMPPYRAIEKYFEDIKLRIHRDLLSGYRLVGPKIDQAAETGCSISNT
jgi:hypothetical protein